MTYSREAEADNADEKDLRPWVRVEPHELGPRRLPTVGVLMVIGLLATHGGGLVVARISHDVCLYDPKRDLRKFSGGFPRTLKRPAAAALSPHNLVSCGGTWASANGSLQVCMG